MFIMLNIQQNKMYISEVNITELKGFVCLNINELTVLRDLVKFYVNIGSAYVGTSSVHIFIPVK